MNNFFLIFNKIHPVEFSTFWGYRWSLVFIIISRINLAFIFFTTLMLNFIIVITVVTIAIIVVALRLFSTLTCYRSFNYIMYAL